LCHKVLGQQTHERGLRSDYIQVEASSVPRRRIARQVAPQLAQRTVAVEWVDIGPTGRPHLQDGAGDEVTRVDHERDGGIAGEVLAYR
jgi:hypothetical protein